MCSQQLLSLSLVKLSPLDIAADSDRPCCNADTVCSVVADSWYFRLQCLGWEETTLQVTLIAFCDETAQCLILIDNNGRGKCHHRIDNEGSEDERRYSSTFNLIGARGGAAVKALRYKAEGRGIDSRWCHWIDHEHNPSSRTMALGLTQPLTEMSTKNISWG
jgi:hypothetical protein